MAVCPLCSSRKGKRACPAKGASICSVCCGEKRIVEIACPRDCIYLDHGIQNDLKREAVEYLQHQDPQKGMRWLRTLDRMGFLLEVIERAIATSPVRSLEDSELLVALESAKKTFGSEVKGVIYEDLPESPTLQALTREIVSVIRSFMALIDEERKKLDPSAPKLPTVGPAEALECLEVVADRCAYHLSRREEAGTLVEHLRRVYPSAGDDGANPPAASRIILT